MWIRGRTDLIQFNRHTWWDARNMNLESVSYFIQKNWGIRYAESLVTPFPFCKVEMVILTSQGYSQNQIVLCNV